MRNNGDGTFQTAVNYGSGYYPSSVFASDLDGDGDNDLTVPNWNSNSVSIMRNNGDGTFQTAVNYGAGFGPSSVFASDLDGDGDKDLAVANILSNRISILINLTSETGIGDFGNAKLPQATSLSQNYPNPFNAQTTIQYSLPTQSQVTIEIFDILGRKIKTLAEGIMPAGNHQATWDASGQSSGIYFYRIKAGEYSERREMVLIK